MDFIDDLAWFHSSFSTRFRRSDRILGVRPAAAPFLSPDTTRRAPAHPGRSSCGGPGGWRAAIRGHRWVGLRSCSSRRNQESQCLRKRGLGAAMRVRLWQFVARQRRARRNATQHEITILGATLRRLRPEEVHRVQHAHLFHCGGGEKLIRGDAIAPGQLFELRTDGVGKLDGDCAHSDGGKHARNCSGVTTLIPNADSMRSKSRVLNVTRCVAEPPTSCSNTVQPLEIAVRSCIPIPRRAQSFE